MDHYQYSVEDFAADPSFRAWVFKTDAATSAWWDAWLSAHEDKRPLVEAARELVLHLQFRSERPRLQEMEAVRNNIDALLSKEAPAPDHTTPAPDRTKNKVFRMGTWTAAAASVILICTVGILSQHRGKVTTATGYGATRKITLPDGSTVALNAHSNLSYSKDWTTEKGREVWIEGEAFFTVARMAAGNSAKFTVHTKGLDIMVLGTAFNVYSRRDKVDVVLENGKVLAKGTGNAAQAGAVSMHPGQMIHLDSSRIRTTEVNTATYTSWKDDRLVFDNKTLADIAHILEDNYGYEVIWKNENAKHYPFTGSCPASNIKLLLSAISEVNDVKITQKDNQLIFE